MVDSIRAVVVGQLLGPVCQSLASKPLLGDGIDVVGQGQRNHRGLRTIDHAAGLLARSAVRRMDGHVSPVVSFQCLANATSYSLYSSRVGSYETFRSSLPPPAPVEEPQPERRVTPREQDKVGRERTRKCHYIFHVRPGGVQ